MQRLGRIMVTVGVLAMTGMWVAAAFGLRGAASDADLRVHVLIGLGSLLLFLLSHLWILFYLPGAVRVLRDGARDAGEEPRRVVDPEVLAFGRRTFPPLVLAVVLAVASFLLGTAVYDGTIDAWVHGGVFYLAVAAEAWAAVREWQAFGAAERSVRRLDRVLQGGTAA